MKRVLALIVVMVVAAGMPVFAAQSTEIINDTFAGARQQEKSGR